MNKIAEFPQNLPLDVSLKSCFCSAYKFSPPPVADMVFNTLFGWKDYFNYKVSKAEGFLFVYYVHKAKMTVLAPLQTEKIDGALWGERLLKLAAILSGYCGENSCTLEFAGIPEIYVKNLPSGKFVVTDDRDNYDYVYAKSDLSALEGRAYAAKRNLIRQFEKKYNWSYEKLGANNVVACRDFIEKWDAPKTKNEVVGTGAYCMACLLTENYNSLELCGGLLYEGKKIIAATVASIVNDFPYEYGLHSTAVVHHENGLIEYKGVYQMINNQFAKHLPESIVYINREEDLGIEGLRKAKMSYNPVMLLKKFRVTLF